MGSAAPTENGSSGATAPDAPSLPDPTLAGFDSMERLLEVNKNGMFRTLSCTAHGPLRGVPAHFCPLPSRVID